MSQTQAERRAKTREALIEAGRIQFGSIGFDKVTIDGLAAAAGLTRGAVYHHFPGKESLFENVFELVEQQLLIDVAAATTNNLHADNTHLIDGDSSLISGARNYIRLASQPAIAQIVLIDGPAVLGPTKYRAIDQRYFLPLVAQTIHAGRPPEPDPLSHAVFAAICELALQTHLHPGSVRAIDQALTQLIRGATVRTH